MGLSVELRSPLAPGAALWACPGAGASRGQPGRWMAPAQAATEPPVTCLRATEGSRRCFQEEADFWERDVLFVSSQICWDGTNLLSKS